MTTEAQKTELLEEFRRYLEKNDLNPFSPNEQPDLSVLLTEMSGLKAEVKAESRQFKQTLDTLNTALTTAQEDNKALSLELAAHNEQLKQQKNAVTRALLLDIIEIYDRLSSASEVLQNYQPVAKLFNHSKALDVRFIKHFKEGQEMTLRRFDHLLQRYQVQKTACIGKRLDPMTMNAVETANEPQLENGIVVEELRPGFLFQDQVLRLAEVKVNKTNPQ